MTTASFGEPSFTMVENQLDGLQPTDTGTNPPTVISRNLTTSALSTTDTQNVTTTYYFDTSAIGATWIVNKFEYDANSNLTAEIDPYGVRTEHYYDLVGNVVEHRYAAGTAEQRSTKMEYNFQNWKTADIDGYGARWFRVVTAESRRLV